MPSLTASIQHTIGSRSQRNQARERNKGHPNSRRKIQTIPVCRQHDSISRKPHSLVPNALSADRQLQQRFKIQNQCTKIASISIHKQHLNQEPNQKGNSIQNFHMRIHTQKNYDCS